MMARQMKDHDSDLVLQRSFDLLDTGGTGRVSKGNLCYVLGVLCDKMTSAEIEELVDEAVRAGGMNDDALGFTQFMNIMKITASTGTDRTSELQRMVSSRANLALN
jgi:Ca2+-binding EF-hand superfamily protein